MQTFSNPWTHGETHVIQNYFFANEIFMACVGVILNPWRASLAAAD